MCEKASASNSSNITTNGIGIGCADTSGYGWADIFKTSASKE